MTNHYRSVQVKVSTKRSILFRTLGSFVLVAIAVITTTLLGACAALDTSSAATANMSFNEYQQKTLAQMRAQRQFQTDDENAELQWNAPQEWRPVNVEKPQKGILLVHGLGDSPWSFHDIAQVLAEEGFLVRTVLLPGHGTQPADMLTVTAEQWQQVVNEQASAMERDVAGDVYLGGFSTGANLVLQYAYTHPEIAGLVLFSPGFKSFPFDWTAPLVKSIRPWIIGPDNTSFPMQTPVRYMNVPTNGYAQFYRTSVAARNLLAAPYEKPVFMVVAQNDSVLNTDYLLEIFQEKFINPKSRLIWYGNDPKELSSNERIFVRNDVIPEQHISQFSHMGLLFSPQNPLYGINGSLRMCLNGQSEEMERECKEGATVWYSDWGYREDGKVHARLTFNPYFEWQTSMLLKTLSGQENL